MKNFQKIKFRQNEEKRTTVAVLEFDDVEHEAGKIWDDWYCDVLDKALNNRKSRGVIIPPFVAITHCSSQDQWNADLGLRIARTKLDMMVYKAKKKYISKRLEKVIDEMTMLNEELRYVNEQIAAEKARYIELAEYGGKKDE